MSALSISLLKVSFPIRHGKSSSFSKCLELVEFFGSKRLCVDQIKLVHFGSFQELIISKFFYV